MAHIYGILQYLSHPQLVAIFPKMWYERYCDHFGGRVVAPPPQQGWRIQYVTKKDVWPEYELEFTLTALVDNT